MTNGDIKITQKKLLSPKQKTACEQIVESGNTDSARANALLLVHAGNTQVEAAKLSGLSLGQIKYWVTRFRNVGLKCFTAELASNLESRAKAPKDKIKKEKKKSDKKLKEKKNKKKEDKKGKSKKKGKKDKNKKKK